MKIKLLLIVILLFNSSLYAQENWEENLGFTINEILDSFPEKIDEFTLSIVPGAGNGKDADRQYMARMSSENLYIPYTLALKKQCWVSGKRYLIPEKTFTGKDLEKEREKKEFHPLFNPQSYRLMVTLPDSKTGGETKRFLQMTVRVYQLWILDNPNAAWEALVKKKIFQPVFKNDLGTIYSYIKENGVGTLYYHLTAKGFLFSSPDIEAVKEMMAVNAGMVQSLASVQKVQDILAVCDYQQIQNLAFIVRAGERIRYDAAIALGATKESLDRHKQNAEEQVIPTFSYLKVHNLKKREATEYDVYSFESSSRASDFYEKTSLKLGKSSVKQKGQTYDPKASEKKIEKKGNLVILARPIGGKVEEAKKKSTR